MAIEFTTTDLEQAIGAAYTKNGDGLIASYAAGWTLTRIDVSAAVFFATSSAATNSSSWGNVGIFRPPIIGISSGPAGFTPVVPDDADLDNSQWLHLEALGRKNVSWLVQPGSSQIGSTFGVPISISYRTQVRLAVATDFRVQLYSHDTNAPTMGITGLATVWVS